MGTSATHFAGVFCVFGHFDSSTKHKRRLADCACRGGGSGHCHSRVLLVGLFCIHALDVLRASSWGDFAQGGGMASYVAQLGLFPKVRMGSAVGQHQFVGHCHCTVCNARDVCVFLGTRHTRHVAHFCRIGSVFLDGNQSPASPLHCILQGNARNVAANTRIRWVARTLQGFASRRHDTTLGICHCRVVKVNLKRARLSARVLR